MKTANDVIDPVYLALLRMIPVWLVVVLLNVGMCAYTHNIFGAVYGAVSIIITTATITWVLAKKSMRHDRSQNEDSTVESTA